MDASQRDLQVFGISVSGPSPSLKIPWQIRMTVPSSQDPLLVIEAYFLGKGVRRRRVGDAQQQEGQCGNSMAGSFGNTTGIEKPEKKLADARDN